MMTGRLPFDAKTPAEMITGHLKLVPPPPSRYAPEAGIPPELDAIVLRLLEKNRDKRFKNAEELRAALATVLSPNSGPIQLPPPAAEWQEPPSTQRVAKASLGADRRSLLILAAVAVVAALLAALGVTLWLTHKG
jgi:serine/threonine-protein kinase